MQGSSSRGHQAWVARLRLIQGQSGAVAPRQASARLGDQEQRRRQVPVMADASRDQAIKAPGRDQGELVREGAEVGEGSLGHQLRHWQLWGRD